MIMSLEQLIALSVGLLLGFGIASGLVLYCVYKESKIQNKYNDFYDN